jgi:predicted nucleotidyltransferase
MRCDQALEILRQSAPLLRERYGVIGARLFGSAARGEDDELSDLDVAVTFDPAAPFDVMKLCGVSGLLSRLAGVDVDVVAAPARDPGLRAAIEREAIGAF